MMRLFICMVILSLISLSGMGQVDSKCFSYSTSIGTGIPMDEPSVIPITWTISGYYRCSQRMSVGVGTGVSVYEKALLPLYANACFILTRPMRFTPFVEAGIGYSFAPDKGVNGGLYLAPSFGIQYPLSKKLKVRLSVGYELQKLSALRKYNNNFTHTEYEEELNHHSVSIRAGILF